MTIQKLDFHYLVASCFVPSISHFSIFFNLPQHELHAGSSIFCSIMATHWGGQLYNSFFKNNSQDILCIQSKNDIQFINAVDMENWLPAISQFFIWVQIVPEHSYTQNTGATNAFGAHVDPPLSWMILLRYSAVRLLRVILCGGPRRWGKTTEVSTTVPWSNYSKQEKS